MRLLLLALALPLAMASPLPNFNDIEKRWAEGHSEQQIHNGLTHRDMTPAWPMHARDGEGNAFATATDERSIEASVLRTRAGSLVEQMRDFAERFMRSKGLDAVIARGEEESVPVLRPRKGLRWSFGEE
ncbi:hypothetical protein PRZ48_006622 [Zasmidium cellare]|uniref:Uncharacterized protein n=1 Tax=Zasmidium cellare TaxID=395010 RepID=A0ABR0ENL1_ZASCE|nr:hypothetical protein PRZ48_006622 [Zasmidium cellare]